MRLRYNGLSTTLGGSLTSSATSVTFAAALTHSGGTAVPTISGGDYIPLSILDAHGEVAEIVWLTAYTAAATSGTIVRGREGTTGTAAANGAAVVCAPTVADAGSAGEWNSDQVSIDEFDDGALDSGWARVDKSGGSGRAVWAERESGLIVRQVGGDSVAELHALVRSISSMSVGDGFMTGVQILGNTANYIRAGIVIADGNASGSGGQVVGMLYTGGAASKIGTDAFTNYTTEDAGGVADDVLIHTGARVVMRTCLVASNSWRTDYSFDGSNWVPGGASKSKTITPAYAGLVLSSWGTSIKGLVRYDYLRRVSGVS